MSLFLFPPQTSPTGSSHKSHSRPRFPLSTDSSCRVVSKSFNPGKPERYTVLVQDDRKIWGNEHAAQPCRLHCEGLLKTDPDIASFGFCDPYDLSFWHPPRLGQPISIDNLVRLWPRPLLFTPSGGFCGVACWQAHTTIAVYQPHTPVLSGLRTPRRCHFRVGLPPPPRRVLRTASTASVQSTGLNKGT